MARDLEASRTFAAAILLLAILIWLDPVSSEAITPADPKEEVALPCLNKSGTAYKARISPKRCAHYGLQGEFAGGVDLESLVWDEWGEPKAHGVGNECGFKESCDPVPVSVFAYRIRNRCGRPVYTRLSARSSFGTTVVRTKGCLGPA